MTYFVRHNNCITYTTTRKDSSVYPETYFLVRTMSSVGTLISMPEHGAMRGRLIEPCISSDTKEIQRERVGVASR